MKVTKGTFRRVVKGTRREAAKPFSYHAIIGDLVSEMAHLIRSADVREFSPPFKLVIIDNRGVVAFTGEVDRNGNVIRSSSRCEVRRFHFPANALITDRCLVTRTFQLHRSPHRRVYG
jgi:hypothetical protein